MRVHGEVTIDLRKRYRNRRPDYLFYCYLNNIMKLNCNCCDGIYNSLDVHFTSACDNKCAHCVDLSYKGLGLNKPDPEAIINTIIENKEFI